MTMKISTKGRYGVRIMLELAFQEEGDLMTAREIAQKQDISEKYVEQIIGILNKARLVRSQRGAAGGYRLARPAAQTTIGQILRATEGGFHIVECLEDNPASCERREECVTMELWRAIKEAVEGVVDNVTLADLVARHNETQNFNYMI